MIFPERRYSGGFAGDATWSRCRRSRIERDGLMTSHAFQVTAAVVQDACLSIDQR